MDFGQESDRLCEMFEKVAGDDKVLGAVGDDPESVGVEVSEEVRFFEVPVDLRKQFGTFVRVPTVYVLDLGSRHGKWERMVTRTELDPRAHKVPCQELSRLDEAF